MKIEPIAYGFIAAFSGAGGIFLGQNDMSTAYMFFCLDIVVIAFTVWFIRRQKNWWGIN